jgi:hypothetical protein
MPSKKARRKKARRRQSRPKVIEIYPHRPDLAKKRFWRCIPCKAYVGCHPDSDWPLGRLANAELRAAKVRAHAAFDPMWRRGGMTRNDAYTWLAKALGIERECCHIGEFDVELCESVVSVCEAKGK